MGVRSALYLSVYETLRTLQVSWVAPGVRNSSGFQCALILRVYTFAPGVRVALAPGVRNCRFLYTCAIVSFIRVVLPIGALSSVFALPWNGIELHMSTKKHT